MVDAPAVSFRQVLGNGTFLRLRIAQLVSQLALVFGISALSAFFIPAQTVTIPLPDRRRHLPLLRRRALHPRRAA